MDIPTTVVADYVRRRALWTVERVGAPSKNGGTEHLLVAECLGVEGVGAKMAVPINYNL